MTITVQRETFAETIEEMWPLLEKHYREISHYPDIELDPDIKRYLEHEANGTLRVFTVRKDCALIGYALFFIAYNMHYSKSLQAIQDVIYLDPASRGGKTGFRLLEYCEDQLTYEGVQVIYHHVKDKHPALGRILESMGYEITDHLYARRLDHGRSSRRWADSGLGAGRDTT